MSLFKADELNSLLEKRDAQYQKLWNEQLGMNL